MERTGRVVSGAMVLAMSMAAAADTQTVVQPPGLGEQPGAVIELATVGPNGGQAVDVNQWGVVTGTTDTSTGWGRAFIAWPRGRLRVLGTVGGPFSFGIGINDRGDVVGQSGKPDTSDRAFRQIGPRMDDLGPKFAEDINNLRVTVGNNGSRAVLWSAAGVVRVLATPIPSGDEGSEYFSGATAGINDRGQAAGFYAGADGRAHAVRWEANGTMTELGIGIALAINEAGDVAGWGNGVAGFLWRERTGWIDLHDVSPLGLNDTGQLVGICGNGTPAYDACVWSERTGVIRLAKPVAGYARASGINDLGEVVGSLGEWDGPGHALWWYEPPPIEEQLAAVRRLIGVLRDDGVITRGRHTSLMNALRKVERLSKAGDAARAARAMRAMVSLFSAGKPRGAKAARMIHVDALMRRLALRLH